tara:strand:- start:195 stop:947 length:753 start_codon:yes stop_codon:yes gene_type:complete
MHHHHSVRVLEIVNQCLAVKDIMSVEDIWLSMLEHFNIDAVMLAVSESNKSPDWEATTYLSGFGIQDDWTAAYREKKLMLVDPVARALFASGGAIVRFSDAYMNHASHEGATEFILAAKKAGFVDGYACANPQAYFTDIACSASIIFREENLSADDHEAIKMILPHLNQIASRPGNLLKPSLNADQIACLKWIGEGKTHWETAIILGLSLRTVKYHLAHAKEIMGVTSTVVAVKKGVVLDLFKPASTKTL